MLLGMQRADFERVEPFDRLFSRRHRNDDGEKGNLLVHQCKKGGSNMWQCRDNGAGDAAPTHS